MDIYKVNKIEELLKECSYPGRGIITGMSEDGKSAVSAYFIMGRSENSRNRVFEEVKGCVFTKAFDESKVKDPSLIIYRAIGEVKNSRGNYLVVTNGDQTDTIISGMENELSFSESLKSRCFEPDAPNLTPRISTAIRLPKISELNEGAGRGLTYQISILKSADSEGTNCNRFTYDYEALKGIGHFIHTYMNDGNPLPTFTGEPERIQITSDIQDFTNSIWNSLNEDNKISLYVRYIDLETGKCRNRLINKNIK